MKNTNNRNYSGNRNSYNNHNGSHNNSGRNTHSNHRHQYNNDYVKVIKLTFNHNTIIFKFMVKKDDIYGYKVYILKTPKPLTNYSMHQAHYLDYSNPYICWDSRIESFKDANAIMFQWARNFRDNCLSH